MRFGSYLYWTPLSEIIMAIRLNDGRLEIGSTYDKAKIDSPTTGGIYPYCKSKELHYSKKITNKP